MTCVEVFIAFILEFVARVSGIKTVVCDRGREGGVGRHLIAPLHHLGT